MLKSIILLAFIYNSISQLNLNQNNKNNKLKCKSSYTNAQSSLKIESNGCSKPEFFEIKGD